MLAGLTNYLFAWQLPLLAAFFFSWPLVGGLLLRWRLRKQEAVRRPRLPRCVSTCIMGGLAGGFTAMTLFLVAYQVERMSGLPLLVPGVIVAILLACLMAVLVVYVAFPLPFASALRVSGPALGAAVVLAVVLGTAAAVPAYHQRQRDLSRDRCAARIMELRLAIDTYRASGMYPDSLADLKNGPLTACPAMPDQEPGYFYLPPTRRLEPGEQRVLLCDLPNNHQDGRNVLLVGAPRPIWLGQGDFRMLLERDENKQFAEALKQAGGL